jgi:glycosyltransferase involved in cell wall biosynthesis
MVEIPPENGRPPMPGGKRLNIVGMGRLDRQKGFGHLLEAFARLAPEFPDWGVVILGEGDLRLELERRSKQLGLEGRVAFPGAFADPFPLLRQAEIFAFPSKFEGQGMALIEAMACGVPAVAFDCPSGPRYIIRPEVDGILVPPEDVAALADALRRLLTDEGLRLKFGGRAREVAHRYDRRVIARQWLDLIAQARPDLK